MSEIDKSENTILIGNGFSIGLNSSFSYESLLNSADIGDISNIFKQLGTTNFEVVLNHMQFAATLASMYGCQCNFLSELEHDIGRLRESLIDVLMRVHGKFHTASDLSEDLKKECTAFLRPFTTIYSTNYDMLLYWVWLYDLEFNKSRPGAGDGFTYSTYEGLKPGGIRFLHGALHLFSEGGVTRKVTYKKKEPILSQIRSGMDEGKFPIIILEGSHSAKEVGIYQNKYLDECFDEFKRVTGTLTTFGISFGPSDAHLSKAIIDNKELRKLYLGVYGTEPSDALRELKRNFETKERVACFYNSQTVSPWGS